METKMSMMRAYQREIHQNAIDHGWWDTPRALPELLCLIHSEVSEALEVYRGAHNGTIGEEMADIVIRVMDLCEAYNIDLEEEIMRKHAINKTRLYRHGGKVC
jgi:NTP pyrophosphatase (non-canonical NTP hydrolase)